MEYAIKTNFFLHFYSELRSLRPAFDAGDSGIQNEIMLTEETFKGHGGVPVGQQSFPNPTFSMAGEAEGVAAGQFGQQVTTEVMANPYTAEPRKSDDCW